jgi:hypothetical protein
MAFQKVEMTEIPRRKTSFGGEGGPLLIPPGAQHIPGTKVCKSCGRKVKAQPKNYYKHSCKCLYYKRTTTFIDVLQDEFLLKQWGKRNVAWGMAQRPDLQIAAASVKPDSHAEQTYEDKKELNRIAAEAGQYAGDMYKATIGSSLHRLTHTMDRGEEVGHVPERWVNDLKVYDETVKAHGIEWVSIESFRVLDDWVKDISECDHKSPAYGGSCRCMGVAGTVDRIGWYRGRLRIFDIKTGSDYNKLGHAMQLAAYAHMVPYQFPGDTRGVNPPELDLNIGYIIYLPEGQGECRIEPFDIEMGWRACQLAKLVWEARDWNPVIEDDPEAECYRIASEATTLRALKHFWRIWQQDDRLTPVLKKVLTERANELKAQGVTA